MPICKVRYEGKEEFLKVVGEVNADGSIERVAFKNEYWLVEPVGRVKYRFTCMSDSSVVIHGVAISENNRKVLDSGGFTPNRNIPGGSEKDIDRIDWLPTELCLINRWALKVIADGNPRVFIDATPQSIWTPKNFEPCTDMLLELSKTLRRRATEAEAMIPAMRKTNYGYVAAGYRVIDNRVMNRHHKQYWEKLPGGGGKRTESREHPTNNPVLKEYLPWADEQLQSWFTRNNK